MYGPVLAGTKVAALVAFVALGFSIGHGNAGQIVTAGSVGTTGVLMAFIPIMFT